MRYFATARQPAHPSCAQTAESQGPQRHQTGDVLHAVESARISFERRPQAAVLHQVQTARPGSLAVPADSPFGGKRSYEAGVLTISAAASVTAIEIRCGSDPSPPPRHLGAQLQPWCGGGSGVAVDGKCGHQDLLRLLGLVAGPHRYF